MIKRGKNFFGFAAFLLISWLNIVFLSNVILASTNISPSPPEHWAWNDFIGWIDFYNTNTINVSSFNLTGYASSTAGDISLDCHTTRIGDICGQSNYQITNDGAGNLSGWAWNDQYGWISFDCNNNGGCGQSNYRAYIDGSGNFQNYAWNDTIGWISFNCDNNGACGYSNYRVLSTWVATSAVGILESSIYDTGAPNGTQLNSVLWHGDLPSGTAARFQFAVADLANGPWNYVGPDGTDNTYYSVAPDASLELDYTLFSNKRYLRYKVFLASDLAQRFSPRVDEVIINWSP